MNNALGLGLHPLMPTSVLLKVPSASHSPMRFGLPNVTLCYFVLECSWSRNHHNFQSYVCVSDLTLSSSFLQILLSLPCQFSKCITYQTVSCMGSAGHHTQSCDAAMSCSLNDHHVCVLSHVHLFWDPMDSTVHQAPAHQAPLSMGFPRQNTGMGCHFLLWGIFPDPGIEPSSLSLVSGFFTTEQPGKHLMITKMAGTKQMDRLWLVEVGGYELRTVNFHSPPMSLLLSKQMGSRSSSKQHLMEDRPLTPAPITATRLAMVCSVWYRLSRASLYDKARREPLSQNSTFTMI